MALDGIRVLDFTRVLAGPYCTLILGDLGAEIIKIENPEGGDDTRGFYVSPSLEFSTYFLSVNRNKKSVTIDIRTDTGRDAIRSLVANADVVIENYRTGVMDRYGIGYADLSAINPDIVRGMVIGGLAHGIGAALYEKFNYREDGQFESSTFADYLMPSVYEIPMVKDVEHCTPSPLTSHGQKGSGEGGYLGAPAAISGAVNDALQPLGIAIYELPMRSILIEKLLNKEKVF